MHIYLFICVYTCTGLLVYIPLCICVCVYIYCGSAGKESACNAGDLGLIPVWGRSPGERKGYPLQYSGPENSTDCIVQGVAKSRTRFSDFDFDYTVSNYFVQWHRTEKYTAINTDRTRIMFVAGQCFTAYKKVAPKYYKEHLEVNNILIQLLIVTDCWRK